MRLRTLVLSLAPLAFASLARAQAPGEVAAQPAVAAPVVAQPVVVAPVVAQPVVVAPVVAQPVAAAPAGAPGAAVDTGCAATCEDRRAAVMADRWAVGLSVGSMSLAPEGSPDEKTGFAVGELALRYRATLHLELAASIAGGRERTADDQDGDLEVNTAVLAARYRFRPAQAWNWFLMAGIGAASVTRHDATRKERSDASQPLGTLGIGIERRFHHLALEAELRAVGLGKGKDSAPTPAPATTAAAAMSTTISPPSAAAPARSGGVLSVGLSYYF